MTGPTSNDTRPISHGTGWLLGLTFACLSAGIVAAGSFYYRNHERSYRAEVDQQLLAVADLKVGELVQWHRERLADGNVFFKNASFSGLVRRFFGKPEDAQARQEIQTWIGKFQTDNQYDQVRLVDAQGVTRMEVPTGRTEMSSTVARRIPEVLRSGQVTFQDFFRNEHDQRIYLTVLAPIPDEPASAAPLGVLLFRIDPETYLYPMIQRWPTPSLTAETLLVRQEDNEVVYLNELRFQKNAALTRRAPLDRQALPATRAVLGQEGVVEGFDYRGVPVIAALRSVPEMPWFLVARIDTAEVYAPLREQLMLVVALIGALLFGAATSVALLWRQQRARFQREEHEADEARARLAAIVKFSEDAIIGKDLDGTITSWNASAERLFGYRAAEMIGQPIIRIIPPDAQAWEAETLKRLQRGEHVEHYEAVRIAKDGRPVDVSLTISPIRDAAGTIIGAAKIARDITTRKQAEEALRQNEEQLRAMFEMASVGVAQSDPNTGRWLRVNQKMCDITGYTARELIQMQISEVTHPDDRQADSQAFQRVVRGEQPDYRMEKRYVRKDGSLIWVNVNMTIIRDAAGRPTRSVAAIEDITPRKTAEAEVLRLNAELEQRVRDRTAELEAANMELEAFSYSVSHDLRAPLRAMDGFSMALLEDYAGKLDDRALDHLRRIRAGSQRMAGLIDDLLHLSQVGRTEMRRECVDLTAMAAEIGAELQQLQPDRNVELVITPALSADADPSLLTLALYNLLENSWKFTSRRPQARVEVGAREQDGRRVFFVRDNGAGFDMAYAGKLFGAFQRLHSTEEFEGTGIGLAIVQRIIHRHGGRVWAEGAVGEGATVYFTLNAEAVSLEAVRPKAKGEQHA